MTEVMRATREARRNVTVTLARDYADSEGVGAYLESSNDLSVPNCRRFGFEVVDEIRIPGGPTIWPMWRDPNR